MKKTIFKRILTLTFISVLAVLTACQQKKSSADAADLPPGTHVVDVIEVIQTSNYTYLQVFENNAKYWIAVTRREAKPGDVLYFTNAMEMTNFHSRELNRDFASILFVNDPSDTPVKAETMQKQSGKTPASRFAEISVEPANGGITIAELYKNKSSYAGKKVKIRGVVVKYNANIMQRNWLHIQDGTANKEDFDLTITTQETFAEGDTVTFEGTIILDKDFGSGYSYSVLMEEAHAVEKSAQDSKSM